MNKYYLDSFQEIMKIYVVRILTYIGLIIPFSIPAFAQEGTKNITQYSLGPEMLIWNTLRSVKVEGDPFDPLPTFNAEIKKMNNTRITIKGYIIPVEEAGNKQGNFVLSLLPYSSCFFCGGAGPETVIEVKAASPITYTTKPVTLSGTFKINPQPGGLFYLLTDAAPAANSN